MFELQEELFNWIFSLKWSFLTISSGSNYKKCKLFSQKTHLNVSKNGDFETNEISGLLVGHNYKAPYVFITIFIVRFYSRHPNNNPNR